MISKSNGGGVDVENANAYLIVRHALDRGSFWVGNVGEISVTVEGDRRGEGRKIGEGEREGGWTEEGRRLIDSTSTDNEWNTSQLYESIGIDGDE